MAVQLIHQQQTIKGIVVDASGEPVIGANVVVEGTTMGTITDFEGTFSISVPKNGKNKNFLYRLQRSSLDTSIW